MKLKTVKKIKWASLFVSITAIIVLLLSFALGVSPTDPIGEVNTSIPDFMLKYIGPLCLFLIPITLISYAFSTSYLKKQKNNNTSIEK